MRIYTSYFANNKRLQKEGIVMIGISLFPPKWFYGVSFKIVAPSFSLLKEENEDVYKKRFKEEVLSRVNPVVFVENLKKYSNGKDVALCCFEKPNEFCHRHLVAEWLKEKLGINVEEFGVKVSKGPQYKQLELF